MSDRIPLDQLLGNGAMPPGPAFEIAHGLAGRIARGGGPVGATIIRVERIKVGDDGRVQIIGPPEAAATEKSDAHAIGGLLCRLINGVPWTEEKAKAHVREAKGALELWPGGGEASAVLEELVALTGTGTYPMADLEIRLKKLRGKLGGTTLSSWVANQRDTPAPKPRYDQAANPELATGLYPVGALAGMIANAQARDATPTPPESLELDLDQVLANVANNPAQPTPLPVRSPPPNVTRRSGPSTGILASAMVIWLVVVVLLLLAAFFLVLLLK